MQLPGLQQAVADDGDEARDAQPYAQQQDGLPVDGLGGAELHLASPCTVEVPPLAQALQDTDSLSF